MLRNCWKGKEGRRKKEEGRRKREEGRRKREEGRSSVQDVTAERRKKNNSTFFNYQFPITNSRLPIAD
ncbi:hypothetical protein [Microcoleus vaginatus]|uniref:hypothetical protein n=1 Tax=Microcoleus vaginatus TaxID=119532 RepID=UPI000300847C